MHLDRVTSAFHFRRGMNNRQLALPGIFHGVLETTPESRAMLGTLRRERYLWSERPIPEGRNRKGGPLLLLQERSQRALRHLTALRAAGAAGRTQAKHEPDTTACG